MALRLLTAVCDACVLYPFHLRNILVQASVDVLYDARWTDEIHDEWTRNLVAITLSLASVAPAGTDAQPGFFNARTIQRRDETS